jgi:isoquinoline 1-oxidoreductase beta subunit
MLSALAAGPALLLGWGLLPPRSRLGGRRAAAAGRARVALNGWLRIGTGQRGARW